MSNPSSEHWCPNCGAELGFAYETEGVLLRMTQFKIEAKYKEQESTIITDSAGTAERFFYKMVCGEKWDRVILWDGATKVKEFVRTKP